ncbi:MAG: aryl sulfotransferase [Planctomycetes bacterium]|nr:aryl sulfotransferase [Planctomycetota bacterium]
MFSKILKTYLPIIAAFYLVAASFAIWGYAVSRYNVFPASIIKPRIREVVAFLKGGDEERKNKLQRIQYHRQEIPRKFDISGFHKINQSFDDPGYLLASYFKKEYGQTVIELIRIQDFKVLYQWLVPIEEILTLGKKTDLDTNSYEGYRAQHPLLLEEGSVVFSSGNGPLVRLDAQSKIEWIIDRSFHHSIERDHNGNLLVPVFTPDSIESIPVSLCNESYAVVLPQGKILQEYPVAKILMDNGYEGLLLGVGKHEEECLHLNDAQPILQNLKEAKIGDVALSIRHLSTVLLYRPETNQVIWLKTGPWLNQHDINLLETGDYSVFGNDIIRNGDHLVPKNTISEIYIYDPTTNTVKMPYHGMLKQLNMLTTTQGSSRILPNGDVYIEETNSQRILRISPEQVQWIFVNGITEKTVGALHWVRYYTPEEIDLSWLKE